MKGKGGIIAGIITLVIGGTVYNVSQEQIVENFSKDTGMSQQQAQEYVENVTEDDLVAFDEIGSDLIFDGEEILKAASETDCVDFYYEWETDSLSCEEGKAQLKRIGNSEVSLGKAYKKLDTESANTEDISLVITLIDRLNVDLNLEIVRQVLDFQTIDEMRKTNSFNKSLLQAALDSD
jgi:hypothetical protein